MSGPVSTSGGLGEAQGGDALRLTEPAALSPAASSPSLSAAAGSSVAAPVTLQTAHPGAAFIPNHTGG